MFGTGGKEAETERGMRNDRRQSKRRE